MSGLLRWAEAGFWSEFFLVLFFMSFLGLIYATYRPSAKRRLEETSQIPLEEDGGK